MITHAVTFSADGEQLGGYLARPEAEGPLPAVVVIHEAYGLNENIRSIARRFAEAGYVALAVDLFAGRSRAACMARLFSGMLLNALDHRGIRGLKAALSLLAERPEVDASRIGAIGFCMGGSLSIAWACTDDRLRVIAPFYAMNPRPLEAVARSCPVVGSYPARDFTTSHGRKLDAALERFDIPHDIVFYPDTSHSFFNDQLGAYDPGAAEDAWRRTLAFFKQHLD